MKTTVHLTTEDIALAALLKLAGVASSGGEAKHLILDGRVRLNGETETHRSRKVRPGDVVDLGGEDPVRITVT